jgi:hypothetical protein
MQGSYDLQRWLMKEYSNDNIDFSAQGIANQCIEYVEDMETKIQELKIDQEIKGEIHTNLESLRYKLNQLVSSIKD